MLWLFGSVWFGLVSVWLTWFDLSVSFCFLVKMTAIQWDRARPTKKAKGPEGHFDPAELRSKAF